MVLRFIIGLLLTSFLPGLALTYIFFRQKEINLIERICFSFGLSLSVTIILGFLLPGINIFALLFYYFVFFLFCAPIIILKFIWREPVVGSADTIRKYVEKGRKQYSLLSLRASLSRQGLTDNQIEDAMENVPPNKQLVRAVIIALIIIFTCFIVYSPHFDYPYPFHYDEWGKIEGAVKSIEDGEYYEEGFAADTESGFYMYIIPTMLATKMDPVLHYKYLPMIFMAMASLTLYILLRRVTGSFSIAVFGMLFFASLKTNINVLGPWFFVPLTMAFPLVYLFFYSFVKGAKIGNEKFFIFAFVFLLLILTVHFFSALFIVPIFIIYLIVRWRFLLKRYYIVFPTLLIPLLGFAFTLKFFPGTGLADMINAFMEYGIFYPSNWVSLMPKYKILLFYGNLAYILAIIGLLIAFKKYKIFAIWAIITGAWFYLNMLVFNQSILIPYLRLLFHFLLGIIPLSAIGLSWCISQIETKIKFGKPLTTIISSALLLTVFITTFYSYYDIPYHLDLYRYIEPEDVKALKFAKDDVLSTVPLVEIAYDLLGFDFNIKGDFTLDIQFNNIDCSEKEKILLENKLFYVLSNKQQDCNFLKPLYIGDRRYLYEATS